MKVSHLSPIHSWLLALMVLALTVPAFAQTPPNGIVSTNIPSTSVSAPATNGTRGAGGRGGPGGGNQERPIVAQFDTDKDGRLMVVMMHDNDIPDGWEREGEDKEYFLRFSPNAYAIGINVFLYGITH